MPKYLTVKQMIAKHSWLTEGGLRNYIYLEKTNGLAKSGAITRLGGKILIDEAKFFAWIEQYNKTNSCKS